MEHHNDGYYLYGNELGKMCGPCETIQAVLAVSGFQFGMEYMEIETTLKMPELRTLMDNGGVFLVSNVRHLTINGVQVDPSDFSRITH